MGPIQLPERVELAAPKRTRRWPWLVVWTLLVFAGGIFAGPYLTERASRGIERLAPALGLHGTYVDGQGQAAVLEPIAPMPMGGSQTLTSVAARVPAEPSVATPSAPEPTIPARAEAVLAAAEKNDGNDTDDSGDRKGIRARHGKGGGRAPAAAGDGKASKRFDPFDTGSDEAAPAKPEPSAGKGDGAAKAGGKSSDSLDGLMNDVTSDKASDKGKGGKKQNGKDIDDMLKEVQKSNPAPAPKKAPEPELPALTPADIAKAMAPVRAKGKECAQRLGQKGMVELKITVGKDGKISDLQQAGGKMAGTPVGDCVEKAARTATFPPNSGLRFDFRIDAR